MQTRARIQGWSQALVGLVLGLGVLSVRGDHYVAQDGQTPDTNIPPAYASWATAASNIQEAIDQAVDGSTVWVKPGVYGRPPSPTVADGATNLVNIVKRLTVRGFSGDPADTIIDAGGGINNRCVRIDTSTSGALTPPFRISGFTLTNGYANGGGVWVTVNNTVRTAIVDNCVIVGNRGISSAGGVYNYYYGTSATLIFSNSVIRGNLNGGMYRGKHARTIITGCRFEDNEPYGLELRWGDTLIENCTFTGHREIDGSYGTALTLTESTEFVVRNCLFARNEFINTAPSIYRTGGAAIGMHPRTLARFYNCTVVSNQAVGYGSLVGGLYLHQSSTAMVWNCILQENYKNTARANYGSGGGGSPLFVISNTCTYPITSYPNSGNLDVDPQFVDFDGQNFRLDTGSPCLNAGANQAWMAGATDLDGLPRIDRAGPGIVDMGCYEFPYRGTSIMIR